MLNPWVKISPLKISWAWVIVPVLFIFPLSFIFWAPIESLAVNDQDSIIDAQRYFLGATRHRNLDEFFSIYNFCYSWNDCLHNYIYALLNRISFLALPFGVIPYYFFCSNMRALINKSFFLYLRRRSLFRFTSLILIFCNPFVLAYASIPSKEVFTLFLISLALRCSIFSTDSQSVNKSLFSFVYLFRFLLFSLILFIICIYRFQFFPVSLALCFCFSQRANLSILVRHLRFRIGAIIPAIFLILLSSSVVLVSFSHKLATLNPLYFLSPFNFPLPINPSLFQFFSGDISVLIFPFAFCTQLSGFFLVVLLIACFVKGRLSICTILSLLICSFIGLIYGPDSARYVSTVSYFVIFSCLLDLSSNTFSDIPR